MDESKEPEPEPEPEPELELEVGQSSKLHDATAIHHLDESNELITIGITINSEGKEAIEREIEQLGES